MRAPPPSLLEIMLYGVRPKSGARANYELPRDLLQIFVDMLRAGDPRAIDPLIRALTDPKYPYQLHFVRRAGRRPRDWFDERQRLYMAMAVDRYMAEHKGTLKEAFGRVAKDFNVTVRKVRTAWHLYGKLTNK